MKTILLLSLFTLSAHAASMNLKVDETNLPAILGQDSNQNGVRDDVEKYINQGGSNKEAVNPLKTKALYQLAAAYQTAMKNILNEKKGIAAAKNIILSQYCLKSIVGLEAGYLESVRLKGKILNNSPRTRVGIRLNTYEGKAGLSNIAEKDWKKGCHF